MSLVTGSGADSGTSAGSYGDVAEYQWAILRGRSVYEPSNTNNRPKAVIEPSPRSHQLRPGTTSRKTARRGRSGSAGGDLAHPHDFEGAARYVFERVQGIVVPALVRGTGDV